MTCDLESALLSPSKILHLQSVNSGAKYVMDCSLWKTGCSFPKYAGHLWIAHWHCTLLKSQNYSCSKYLLLAQKNVSTKNKIIFKNNGFPICKTMLPYHSSSLQASSQLLTILGTGYAPTCLLISEVIGAQKLTVLLKVVAWHSYNQMLLV